MSAWQTKAHRLLVADDDLDLLALISFALRNAGYDTVDVASGAEALASLEREAFSLLMLDVNMPVLNGLEVCVKVRERFNTPVLMLSARDREEDLLQALDAGADAYLTKPFSPRTLIARVGALLRRKESSELPAIKAGVFSLDLNESQLVHPDGSFPLTRLEARVLRLLMINDGKTVDPKDLLTEVWDSYNAANRNMLKQTVFRLRRKLSIVPSAVNALQTVSGGYRWGDCASIEQTRVGL